MEKLIKNCQILYVKYKKKDWLDILNVFELFDFLFLQKIKFTFQRKNNISLVQLSHSVMSNSLRPHGPRHARPPWPTPTPGVYPNSCPSSSDAIQSSHPLLSPSPPAPNPSQHQGLFQWVSSSHQVAKVLEFQLQHQSFQWTPRTDLLCDGLVGSPCSPRDSQESSPTPQFKSINSSELSFLSVQLSHPDMAIGKTIALTRWTFVDKVLSLLLMCCLGWSYLSFQGVSISIKIDGEIKLSDEQKLRVFSTTKPALQQMLNGLL